MGADDGVDDGESDSGPAVGAISRSVDSVEPIEKVRHMFGGDAGSVVRHPKHNVGALLVSGERDLAACRSVPQSIVQEVGQHLRESVRVGQHARLRRCR